MKRKPHFTVFKAAPGDEFLASGRFYWRLRGANGEIVAQSEGYATRSSAIRATRNLKRIVLEAQ